MEAVLASLIVGMVVKLWPLLDTAAYNVFQLMVDQIPSEAKTHREWVQGCIALATYYATSPDVREEDKSRYAADACLVLARMKGIVPDEATFKMLGLPMGLRGSEVDA